jgi:hypothetical protein
MVGSRIEPRATRCRFAKNSRTRPKTIDGHRPVGLADALAGVLPPDRLAELGVVEATTGSTVGVGGPKPRPSRSCRGDDPAVTVVMTVPSSEGTVLIDYQTLTAAGLAAVGRAGSPS